ncbi:MAG: efflux RND transporter periplasmic adaptor subunit [Chthoniobacterales bacterium]
MKRYVRATLFVLALLLVILGWRKCRHDRGEKFLTTIVGRGSITQAVTATGTLNPVVNVQVGSQISGNIQKLFADFNTPVKAGQVIAQIDPAVFQASVAQAEGDVANARAGLELAKVNAGRTQALVAKQNSAASELDQATATLHQAEAALQIKEGALAKTNVDLDHCAITSPIDGVVISRNVDVGQTVAASLQAPVIFTIANDLAKMQIDTNVAEADIGAVSVGQTVDFTVDAFPSRTFHGEVAQVRNAPITVQNVVTYDTVIGVTNPEMKLKPGMTANVSIVIAHRDNVLKVGNAAFRFRPANASSDPKPFGLQSAGERSISGPAGRGTKPREPRAERPVYVLAGGAGQPRPVSVKVGISDGISTEVTEGLKENDRVVTAVVSPNNAAAAPAANPISGSGGPRRF